MYVFPCTSNKSQYFYCFLTDISQSTLKLFSPIQGAMKKPFLMLFCIQGLVYGAFHVLPMKNKINLSKANDGIWNAFTHFCNLTPTISPTTFPSLIWCLSLGFCLPSWQPWCGRANHWTQLEDLQKVQLKDSRTTKDNRQQRLQGRMLAHCCRFDASTQDDNNLI